ncbi:TetR/AcrR family transcriptional regulator [Ilumatobacter sp.]|uniref:TetR/AcrR family transcriptional regulator n=1 Tax=Ilumatobacter sp. TaxID=1967498 RepID=UPI003C6BCDA7
MVTTRDRIIVATNELFRRYGYNGTSLSQISEAAEATTGSIYHFFPGGKEALGVAVIDTTGAVYRELFESIAAEHPDPVDAFENFFDSAADVLEESDFVDPCPIGTIAREVANTSEPLRRAAERAFSSWIASAENYLINSDIDPDAADDLATMFVATVEGGFVLSRTLRCTDPLRAIALHVVAAVSAAPRTTHATLAE